MTEPAMGVGSSSRPSHFKLVAMLFCCCLLSGVHGVGSSSPAPAAAAVLRVDTAVNVSENTMARSICVTVISADPGQVTEITLSLSLNGSSSGFATMGDFMLDDMTIMINTTLNESTCFMFMPLDDLRVEATECFYFEITVDGSETFENGSNMIQACILDDDGASVQLQPTSNILENSSMTRGLCAQLTSNSSELERPVVLELDFSSMSSSQFARTSDYRLENYSLTIFPDPTNETVCATFSPVDDGLVEDTEYFQFNVRTQNGNDMVDNSTFRISILDDDGARIMLSPTVSSLTENSSAMMNLCGLTDTTLLEREVSVTITFNMLQSSPYANGDDFSLGGTISFTGGSSIPQCTSFTANSDSLVENDETFILQASTRNALDYFMGEDAFNVTIVDEDGAQLSLQQPMSISENSSMTRELCVMLDTNSTQLQREVVANVTFLESGFSRSNDFMLSATVLTFTSSSASRMCVVFDPVNDTIVEYSETFQFQVEALNSLDNITGDSSFTAVIEDDDGFALETTQNSTMVSESVGVLLCVQPLQNATLERAVEVTFSPSNADDYELDTNSTSLGPGDVMTTQQSCITLVPEDDMRIEQNEDFTIYAAPTNSLDSFVGGNQYTVQITDNDGAQFTLLPTMNTTEGMTAQLCVNLSSSLTLLDRRIEISITFSANDSSSYANSSDFNLNTYMLTFVGSILPQQCFMFEAVDDMIVEDAEAFTFQVTSNNPLDYFSGGDSNFRVYIIDDDGLSLSTLPASNLTEGTNGSLCIESLNDTSLEREVITSLSPTSSAIFTIFESELSFSPGPVSMNQQVCFTIQATADEITREDMTLIIYANTVNSLDSFVAGGNDFTFQILDDDFVEFSVLNMSSLSVQETDTSGNTVSICIQLNTTRADFRRLITLYAGCPNSAPSSADMCNTTASRSLVFDPMMVMLEQCVNIGIRGDNIIENTETFNVIFSTNADRVLISNNNISISIIDDDGVVLSLLPPQNIFENSTMNRTLCAQLTDIGEGLERQVHIDIMFLENRTRFAEMRDFSLNYMPLYFNSMSMVNDTLCWTFTPVDDQRIEDTENFYFNVSTSNDLDIISTTSVFNIAISDNDGARFTAENVSNSSLYEGNSFSQCLVVNNTIFERNSTIRIQLQEMGYANNADIMLMEDFVTFQAGTYDFQRQCFSGQIIDDSVAETTEQFEFNFLPENSFDYTDPGSFRFQVMDRDGVPVLLDPATSIEEDAAMPFNLCVRLNVTMLQRIVLLNIFFDKSRSSLYANSDDFVLDNSTIAFNSSSVGTAMCWTYRPNNDLIPENNETFFFYVSAENPLDMFPEGNTFEFTISDDGDGASLQVEPVSDIRENSTMTRYLCVTLNSPQLQRQIEIELFLETTSSMYAMESDFTIGGTNLTFNSSLANRTLCASFTPVNDMIVESTECFNFRARTSNAVDTFVNGSTQISICIEDDDRARITLQQPSSILENSTMSRDLCVLLYPNTTLERSVTVNVTFESSRSSPYARTSDFSFNSSTSLTFTSSNANSTNCVTLYPENDQIVENDETFVFEASTPYPDYFVYGNSTFMLTIYDDDGALLSLMQQPDNIFEQSNMTRFLCLSLNMTQLERQVVVEIMFIKNDSSAFARPSDFRLSNYSLIFSSSNAGDTLCGAFQTVNDNLVEANETFIFQASAQNARDSFLEGYRFQLTIYDNDAAMLALEQPGNIFENSNMARDLCLNLVTNSSYLERDVTIAIMFMRDIGSFSMPTDFILNQTYFTFVPSGTDRQCVAFDPVDDMIIESNETFQFELLLQNELNTITDNDTVFSISIYDDDGLMLATQPADNIMEQSTVTRNLCVESLEQRQLERNVAISLRSMLSGYANPGDFMINTTMVYFTTGSVLVNQTICFAFKTKDDKIIEDVETFYFDVYAANPLDGFRMGRDNFTLQIYDDDGATLMIATSNDSIREDSNMTREVCITLSNIMEGLERDVMATITFSPAGFSKTSDFMLNDYIHTFNSSSMNDSKMCSLFDPVNDGIIEADERFYFNVSLANPLDMLGSGDTFTFTIVDDDGAVVSSSATQFMATITEGAPMNRSLCIMIMDIGDGLERSIYASLEFMASATQPFSTSDDFRLLDNDNRRFPPNSSESEVLCFLIAPIDDDDVEDTESFQFNISLANALDRAYVMPQLELIIVDNDVANIQTSLSQAVVTEGDVFMFCAAISQTLQRDISVMPIFSDDMENDVMYAGENDTVFLSPTLSNGCVDLMASFDDLLEVPETVGLMANNSLLENSDAVMPSVLNVTVMDNNVAQVMFSVAMLTLNEEAAGNTQLCVEVAGTFTSGYVLNLTFYTSSSEDVNIINTTLLVDNAATHCIYVQAVDDSIIEAEEMFTISVSWMPGDNSTSIPVTIIDNDRAIVGVDERDLIILEGLRSDGANIVLTLSGSFILNRTITGTIFPSSSIPAITITISPSQLDFSNEQIVTITASDDGSIVRNSIRRPLSLTINLNNSDVFMNVDGSFSQTRVVTLTIIEDDSILVEGKDYIAFLPLNLSDGRPLNVVMPDGEGLVTSDFISQPIFPTSALPFGSLTFRELFVTSEGAITFGRRSVLSTVNAFSNQNTPILGVFLTDHDARTTGRIAYKTYSITGTNLDTVNNFIQSSQSVTFQGTWMLVAEWRDVPEINQPTNLVNTYQAIVVTDFTQTYAVFTYNCEELRWTGILEDNLAAIGYATTLLVPSGNVPPFYNNPFSKQDTVNQIACSNVGGDRNRPWANAVQKIGESQENVNDARCLAALEDDQKQSVFNFGLGVLQDNSRPCPCSLFQAIFDRRFILRRLSSPSTAYFVPTFPGFLNGFFFGYACAYSISSANLGAMLPTEENSIGTFLFVQRSHPLFTIPSPNVDLANLCCLNSNQCDQFIRARPPNNCQFYRPPRRSWGFGDPHFETLDGGNYTFNGWGEYTLLEAMDGFTLQGRTTAVNTSDDTSATQFSAFVLGFSNASVQINLNDSALQVLLNGIDITNTVLNVADLSDGAEILNISNVLSINRTRNSTVEVSFSNNIAVTFDRMGDLLQFALNIDPAFAGNVSGLLGNFNGDNSDDFIFQNGSTLGSSPSDMDIHTFGQSWQIDGSSSLFTYPLGQTYLNFTFPNHSPQFLDDVINNANSSVVNMCNGNALCIFDAMQTGNLDVGLNTMEFNQVNVVDREEAENFPPTITGPNVFQVISNVTSTFTIEVNDTNLRSLVILQGPTEGVSLANSSGAVSTTYTLTWTPASNVTTHFIFLATDERDAISMFAPRVEICPCLNNGSCTNEGLVNPSANPLVLNCICTPAYDGDFCERNFNACTEGLCFAGVNCIDRMAPEVGADCAACPMGFNGTGFKCQDIDECATNMSNCQQQCNNIPGSFQCSCFPGFRPVNSTHCENIDECQMIGRCHQTCNDTIGSFVCSCNEGFTLTSDSSTCAVAPGFNCSSNNCSELCTRNPNTTIETCSCNPGASIDSDGFTCNNIDECSGALSPCSQICTDTDRSFNCSCRSGFNFVNNTQCDDVNECTEDTTLGMSRCNTTTSGLLCVNNVGSYTCECPAGTTLVDGTCTVPEPPTSPAPTTPTPEMFTLPPSTIIRGQTLNFTLFESSVAEFLSREGEFRILLARSVNIYCASNPTVCMFSEADIVRRQDQTITADDIVITDIEPGPGGNGVMFNVYILRVGTSLLLSREAILAAVEANRGEFVNSTFLFDVGFIVPPTTASPPLLNSGEIAGIVIGCVAALIIFLLLLGACIFWCCSRYRRGKFVFNTYGQDPNFKSGGVELRGGHMVEENQHITRRQDVDPDTQSMQSVQLEFTEARSEPSPEPMDLPDYNEATADDGEKSNLAGERSDLPPLEFHINFMEDANKDTAL